MEEEEEEEEEEAVQRRKRRRTILNDFGRRRRPFGGKDTQKMWCIFWPSRATKANTIELTRLSFFLSFFLSVFLSFFRSLLASNRRTLLTKLMTAVTPVLKSIRQEITDSGRTSTRRWKKAARFTRGNRQSRTKTSRGRKRNMPI